MIDKQGLASEMARYYINDTSFFDNNIEWKERVINILNEYC